MKKSTPTRRQSQAIADQHHQGDKIRQWVQSRIEGLKNPLRQRELEDRRIERIQSTDWVVRHFGPNRAMRKASRLRDGSLRPSRNAPHVNPARDTKRHARLRKAAQS